MRPLFGLHVRTVTDPELDPSPDVPTEPVPALPPSREPAGAVVTPTQAMGVSAVFRGFQVLVASASQLALDVERNDQRIDTPSIITKPCLGMTRADWVEQFVLSLAATGNAFMRKVTVNGTIVNLPLLDANKVHVGKDQYESIYYDYEGTRYTPAEITHVGLLRLPGMLKALGPIQAARAGLSFNRGLTEYLSRWWIDSGQDNGVLTTDQPITADDARKHQLAWNGFNPDGTPIDQTLNPKRVKVMGKGLSYESLLLKPEDAQWLQSQNWNLREAAVVLGIPPTLMLVGYDGASRTYTNSDAEWLGYVRFTLMWYLGKIEDALSDVLVRGQVARFRIESLLRSDTKTRYEGYKLAIDAGWMTPAEVRPVEKLAPHPAIADEPRAAKPAADTIKEALNV